MALQTRSVLAITSWVVLAAALGFQGVQAQQSGGSRLRGKQQAPQPLPSVQDRIDRLQTGIQNAVDDLTMTNLREMNGTDSNGKPIKIKVKATFGLSRTPTILLQHNGVLRDSRVPAFNMQVEFYAVSCSGKPLNEKLMSLHPDFGGYARLSKPEAQQEVVSFATKAVKPLRSDQVYRGLVDGCEAQAKALKLSKPECLSCHPGMRVGDPAAILVYLVRPVKSGKVSIH